MENVISASIRIKAGCQVDRYSVQAINVSERGKIGLISIWPETLISDLHQLRQGDGKEEGAQHECRCKCFLTYVSRCLYGYKFKATAQSKVKIL